MSDQLIMQDKENLMFADEDLTELDRKSKNKWKVMIVDDEKEVHKVTQLVLSDFEFEGKMLEFINAYSGQEAKKLICKNPDTAVILLDVVMEEEDAGLKLAKHIRRELNNTVVRIILRTGQPGQAPERDVIVEYDINDYKEKTELTSNKLFTTMVSSLRTYKDLMTIVDLSKEVENTQKEVIFTLGEVAEARSKETGNHVKRVAEYSKLLALKYGLSNTEAEIIKMASPMHDVGKLGIPDAILNKPGKLSVEEFEIMKTHSAIGYEILNKSNKTLLKSAAIIALQHHERFNGTGYPLGLNGEKIHVYGRITAIADVFDALGSNRVYKKAWDLDTILELFRTERGQHFDPMLVDIFFSNLDEIIFIRDCFKDV